MRTVHVVVTTTPVNQARVEREHAGGGARWEEE